MRETIGLRAETQQEALALHTAEIFSMGTSNDTTESLPVVEEEVEIFSVCLVEAKQSSPSLRVLLPSFCDHTKGLDESP